MCIDPALQRSGRVARRFEKALVGDCVARGSMVPCGCHKPRLGSEVEVA